MYSDNFFKSKVVQWNLLQETTLMRDHLSFFPQWGTVDLVIKVPLVQHPILLKVLDINIYLFKEYIVD